MSVQRSAVVSQNSTWPVVTGWPASITRAIKVTTLPAVTVVTALPVDVTASVVVVAFVAQAGAVTTDNSIKPARNVIAGDLIRRRVVSMQDKKLLQDADEESIRRFSSQQGESKFSSAARRKEIPGGATKEPEKETSGRKRSSVWLLPLRPVTHCSESNENDKRPSPGPVGYRRAPSTWVASLRTASPSKPHSGCGSKLELVVNNLYFADRVDLPCPPTLLFNGLADVPRQAFRTIRNSAPLSLGSRPLPLVLPGKDSLPDVPQNSSGSRDPDMGRNLKQA